MLDYQFQESGPRSRAWWLRLIKVADNPTVSNLVLAINSPAGKVQPALDTLVDQRFIVVSGKTWKKYTLTTLGHRYLDQNQHELAGEGTPTPSSPKTYIGDNDTNPSSLIGKRVGNVAADAPKIKSPFGDVKPEYQKDPIVPGKPIQGVGVGVGVATTTATVERVSEESRPTVDDEGKEAIVNVPPEAPIYPPKDPVVLPIEWCTDCCRFIQGQDPVCLEGNHLITSRPDAYYKNESEKNKPVPGTLTVAPEAIAPFIQGSASQVLKDAMYEILMFKYGRSITAVDLIKFVEEKNHGTN
jgi:hypothetical protein